MRSVSKYKRLSVCGYRSDNGCTRHTSVRSLTLAPLGEPSLDVCSWRSRHRLPSVRGVWTDWGRKPGERLRFDGVNLLRWNCAQESRPPARSGDRALLEPIEARQSSTVARGSGRGSQVRGHASARSVLLSP